MAENEDMKVNVADLVTTEDIAARLLGSKEKANLVRNWRVRNIGFPIPIKETTRTSIWDWPKVEEWAKLTGRLADDGTPTTPSTVQNRGPRKTKHADK